MGLHSFELMDIRSFIVVPIMLFALALTSCGESSKTISKSYVLEHFSENGLYYLIDQGKLGSTGGVFEGTIKRIGWNDKVIVCDVKKQYRGEADGVYILWQEDGRVEGPVSLNSIEASPSTAGIELKEVSVAFREL